MRVPGPSRIGRAPAASESRPSPVVAGRGRRFHEAAGRVEGLEQPFDPPAQLGLVAAGPVEEGGALGRVGPVQGLEEDGAFGTRHGEVPPGSGPMLADVGDGPILNATSGASSRQEIGFPADSAIGDPRAAREPDLRRPGSISRRSQARA